LPLRLVRELSAARDLDREAVPLPRARPLFELLARVAGKLGGVVIVGELKPLDHDVVVTVLKVGSRTACDLFTAHATRPSAESLRMLGNHGPRIGHLHGPGFPLTPTAEDFVHCTWSSWNSVKYPSFLP